nr:MAG TPA: hypothetical protein [Caudoviricetes sp.]
MVYSTKLSAWEPKAKELRPDALASLPPAKPFSPVTELLVPKASALFASMLFWNPHTAELVEVAEIVLFVPPNVLLLVAPATLTASAEIASTAVTVLFIVFIPHHQIHSSLFQLY